MSVRPKARIALITVGGTIVSLADDPLDTIDYPEKSRKIDAHELLAALPQLADLAEIIPIPYRAVSSSEISWADWAALLTQIEELNAAGLDGAVITHGTGTLEETLAFLRLTYQGKMPVVLTGAQRPLSAIGSDAPVNLIGAVLTAAAPQSRGRGALLAMNGEIHRAGAVTKTDTAALGAFLAPRTGPIGHTQARIVHYHCAPTMPEPGPGLPAALRDRPAPRVEVIYAAAGADGLLAKAALSAVRTEGGGLVFAGFAPGLVAPAQRRVMIEAASLGIPVVMASRSLSGDVFDRAFLRENGILAARGFNPQKARIVLALCLANSCSLAQIQRWLQLEP